MKFGNLGVNKRNLMGEVSRLDEKEGAEGHTNEERSKRKEMKSELERLITMEEISWQQKSRVCWLKEEDNNTRFFHQMLNSHRSYNHLGFLEVSGSAFEYS